MRLSGSHTYSKQPVPKMPPGLVELMEGLTRDVLKNNPVDVYDFCANHMLKLLEIRDGQKQRMLTLEQKISRAQEKVRQRAKERHKRFDKTSQQLAAEICQKSEPEGGSDVTLANKASQEYDNVGKENLLKAPIHHESDLEEAYEVEIFYESASNAVAQDHEVNVLQSVNIPLTRAVNESNEIRSKELDVEDLIDTNASSYGEMYVDNNHELCLANNTSDHITKDDINKEVDTEIKKTDKELSKIDDTIEQVAYENDDFKSEHQKIFNENECNYDKDHVGLATFTPEETAKLIEFIDHERFYSTINMAINQNTTENPCHKVTNFECVGNDIKLKNNSELALYHIVNEVINDDNISKVVCDSVDKIDEGLQNFSMATVEDNSRTTDEVKNPIDNLHEIFEKQADSTTTTVSKSLESKENLDNSNENQLVAAHNRTDHDKVQENISTDISEALEPDSEGIFAERSSSVDESANGQHNHGNVDRERTKSFEDNNKIHNTSMDLETAAITIQKVFRTFLFKNKSSTFDDDTNIEPGDMDVNVQKEKSGHDLKPVTGNLNKDRRTLVRMDTVLQTVNEEKSLSLSTDDSSTLSSAATIIQAHVRGFLVRNKLNLNKTISNSVQLNSDGHSNVSQDGDAIRHKKTILNIHIVPEGGHYMSRDESLLTSMELPLDGSPMSSINLHPLGYKREPRKQLKREDAIQSVSPPSNNSGKSVDADDIKDVDIMLNDIEKPTSPASMKKNSSDDNKPENHSDSTGFEHLTRSNILIGDKTTVDSVDNSSVENQLSDPYAPNKMDSSMIKENNSFDEMDVVTPVSRNDKNESRGDSETCRTKLLHSGEFHDAVLPTKVSRSDTSVVREFKNVLVYFLMWNN